MPLRLATCVVCGKQFRARTAVHSKCSDRCRRESEKSRWSEAPTDRGLIGEAAELYVAADLMRQGVIMYQNVARTGPADLIAWVPKDHSVALIDVKGLNTTYVRADGTRNRGYPDYDPARRTWIVVVHDGEVDYPQGLLAMLGL